MNFGFHNPTHIIFGAGSLSRLGEVVCAHGKKALLVIGGGSVKRNGTFERAVSSLEASGVSMVELSGVDPNPRITSVRQGAQIARDNKCDVVVALGVSAPIGPPRIAVNRSCFPHPPGRRPGLSENRGRAQIRPATEP